MNLSTATLPALPVAIHTPTYERTAHAPGVVHLGLGAFHRAHQAMVFDQLLASGDMRWGIHGVGMTRPDLVNQLRAQDGLYAVRVADGQGVQWQVPGALWRMNVAATERDAVVQAIAAPSTRWVTLTVTEKGYTPTLAQLLLDGLRMRQQAGLPGITIASCDNLQGNGHKLQAMVKAAATAQDADVLRWLDAHCAFPCSMVDRIVPAATPEVMAAAHEALGVQDQCALSTEGFWEWVIEDRLADPADAALLQSAGVRVTGDVHSYEEAKLRMLNGSHSAMALMGAVTGRPFIASCIGVPHIRSFVHRLMSREVSPHLSRSDWAEYRDALIARFGNPYLKHSVHQIATDSSQKIPQRWPPSVLGQMAQGASFEHHALAAAVFLRYTLSVDEQGQAYALNDPQAESLMAIGAAQRTEPEACVRALLAREDLWGNNLPGHAAWTARVTHWHQQVMQHGVDAAIQQLLEQEV
ncbi:mannitol dehydrogenase [Limnohabitans sp. MMS-10A-160]|jgi:fructuronate reductase|uniref:mannitol dehydrogenase family protein n=1 Tax=unclassified Limnohabitans TaxID=2626134 RepID=UPI000D39A1BA|nr:MULTISPECIES: mannitol dehydrogenase family protein [unclassified Limnohabitans]PUE18168.1 mannitol dehydrogenase [Limnohabitans sp. MMS-10A-192]PUE27395.1 mannitol dehydrogenase [Limnohabitans sp. MMS-10A-160]